MWLVHQLFYISLITLYSCNRTVGCNRTVEAANHTKSTQLNPPITELITTIATTTYPEKKREISKFFALDIVPTGDVCPTCNFFSEIVIVMINWWQDFVSSNSVGNHTSDWQIRLPLRGRPILLITRMITDRIGLHLVPLGPRKPFQSEMSELSLC